MVAHARIIAYFESNCLKHFVLYYTGKLCSKFGEDRSTNNVTILSTDRRMDGRTDVYVIL